MVTFLITVRSPEVVIRSAIIPPSKYSRHESSIRDVEIACGMRGYLGLDTLHTCAFDLSEKFRSLLAIANAMRTLGNRSANAFSDSAERAVRGALLAAGRGETCLPYAARACAESSSGVASRPVSKQSPREFVCSMDYYCSLSLFSCFSSSVLRPMGSPRALVSWDIINC